MKLKLRLALIPLLLLFAVPPPGPVVAARKFSGSSQFLQAASVDLSAANKLSLSYWLYWDAYDNVSDLFAYEFTATTSSNNGFACDPNSSAPSSGFMRFIFNCGSVVGGHITRPSAAAWHHYVVEFDASVNPDTIAVWVDGSSVSFTYTAQPNGTGNFANSTMNFMSRNGSSLFGAGRLAEYAIYPGVLLAANDIAALAAGYSPALVRPGVKPYYWPLLGRASPETELFYGKTAAVTSATQTEHVRVYHAGRMQVTP